MIEEDYNIVYVNSKHYYQVDLRQRYFNLEKCSPFFLSIGDEDFTNKSWGRLLEDLANHFIKNSKTVQKCKELKLNWSNQHVFIDYPTLDAHLGPLENGLYINVNHTSTHLLWILQDMIKYFDVNLDECKLLRKKMPGVENAEVNKYFYEKTKERLEQYLKIKLKLNDNVINKYIKNIITLDKVFESEFKSYKSLLLFESKTEYAQVKSRFLKRLSVRRLSTQTYNKIKNLLHVLTSFYGYTHINSLTKPL